MRFDFYSDTIALTGVNKAKSQPLMGSCSDIDRGSPVRGEDPRRVLRSDTGHDRTAVRAEPPVLDKHCLIEIDGKRLALRDDQCARWRWTYFTVTEWPEVDYEGAGMAKGQCESV